MVAFLRRLLGPKPPPPPLLLRIKSSQGFVKGAVHLRATWSPSGRVTSWSTRVTQGLCHLPWAGGNKVDVEVRFGDEVGYSTIDRAARETGDVQPIQCHPDKNLAGNENGATAANSSIGCKAS